LPSSSGPFLRGVELLIRGSNSADRTLFAQVGLGLLSTGALALIAILDLAAIRYMIKPAPVGRLICLASIGLSAVQTSIGFAIARVHPEAAGRAIVVSRESRGLPVREDAQQTIMDPTMSLLLWGGSLAVSGLLAFVAIKNHWYLFSRYRGRDPREWLI
jgi:hypothetical protein